MKIPLIILSLALAPLCISQAAENRGLKLSPEQKKKILKKFDKDGDGKLNEQEAAAARKALNKKRTNR